MIMTRLSPKDCVLSKWLAVSAGLLCISMLSGCSRDSSGKQPVDPRKTALPVTAGTAVQKDVPLQVRVIGSVQPYSTVSIKARVEGELIGVHFKDGQELKKGDLLFTIDPRPFEAKLKLAEANLARDKAQFLNAQAQEQRYGSVVEKGYVTKEQYDTIKANAAALAASVQADTAAVESAKLDLGYCTIRSPINGIAGSVRITQGNILKANDNENPLVTIKQIRPVYVSFAVPERNLPEIMKYMEQQKLTVLAWLPGNDTGCLQGELTFVENEIKSSAGTILAWATFSNQDKHLWPGQFVNVVLTLTTQKEKTVIPSQAVQMGQAGSYVFVIKPDMSVEYRPISPGARLDREIVVENGVSPGELVVTDGQLRLTTGSLVKLVDAVDKVGSGGTP
jgi:membrane fusion protein, multidrug efflux system